MHKIQTEFHENVSVLKVVDQPLNHAGNGFSINSAIYLAP